MNLFFLKLKLRTKLNLSLLLFVQICSAQSDRWQMAVNYKIKVDFITEKNQYNGDEYLTIYNKSPDTLNKLFYHLYFNAFQPGSDMDIRSLQISDPDSRIGSRISKLNETEIGFIRPSKINQGKKSLSFNIEGTILEIKLHKALLPNDSTIIRIQYLAQVPIQIRRSGRNNKEGIDYSMAQWYPKLCNYDEQGWHTDPYIGREFYAPWGNFNVEINIDPKYVVAATGYQINDSITIQPNKDGVKKWQFYAPMVHDFVWTADPDYKKDILNLGDGRSLQFFHQANSKFDTAWMQLPSIMSKALSFIEKNFGPYPYKTYSFIQGGDGGMEYPMATLITGNRPLISLVGVCLHEWMHSWYQMMLGSNESLYPWMDEGFTSYAEAETMNYLKGLGLIPGKTPEPDPMQNTRKEFVRFQLSDKEEALSTHADHYVTNQAYGVAAYSKGALCLMQLKYIIGEAAFKAGMLNYYWTWRFKHPNPNDFFRIMEKASDIELDWFKEYWVYTTKRMDYAIDTVLVNDSKTVVRLKRIGLFPMPVDLLVKTKKADLYYTIPLDLMRGPKHLKNYKALSPWHWVNPFYEIILDVPIENIVEIVLDPNNQMVDTDPMNNFWVKSLE
ncbi:MAG: M1 family metallopeptidase [Saprospiraceae bacterium]